MGWDALVLTELPWCWWQDRGWSWGCAAVFAGAGRLLVDDSVWPGHQNRGKALAEPPGALGLPRVMAQVAGDE